MPISPTKPNTSSIIYPKVTFLDILRIFGVLARKHWLSIAIAVTAVSIAAVMQIIIPTFYKSFFDIISSGQNAKDVAPALVHIVFVVLGLNGILWLTFRINDFGLSYFQTQMMARLRTTAFDYMIGHAYSFFSNNFTGTLTQRVNRFARAFERLSDRFVWEIVPLVIKIVGIAVVLFMVSHFITYAVIIWLILFTGFNYGFARWKLKYDVRSAELDSRITGTLSDAITNHSSIQLFNGHRDESKTYESINAEWKKLNFFRWNLDNVVNAVQFGLIIVVEFCIFYYGIKFWENGLITVGTFVLVQAYLISLADRLWNFSRLIRDIYEAVADSKEMVEILKLEHEIRDIPNAKVLDVVSGVIDFKDVIFSFNQTRTVLDGISLHVKGGEKIALVGPSGGGKSTFVRLLLRLYEIQGGEILIDGQNIGKVTQKSLRENISLVPQDPLLFHRTLMENIRYGRPSATDEEVINVARMAHCDEFIESLPYKYDTYVGERGIKLSGGERQRVAIARAILKNAPILVLDEATSSLDSHSEMLIQDALDTLMKGKTTLVIAHRLSTIRKMNRIIVLDKGFVTEEGTHEALIAKTDGLYAKLWSLQAGGFLKYENSLKEVGEIEEEDSDEE